ncbi:carbohydrate sulfotransferase 11-like [Oculina patagonica]
MSPEERQNARKQQLRDYCRTHTYNKNPATEKLHRIAVDDELKLIYGIIPKVATTTWKQVLRSAQGIQQRTGRWNLWKRFSNYTEEERSKRLQTYFKFVFVREPLQRLLSAYKDKFIKKPRASNDIRRVIVQAFRPQDFEPEGENFVSFSEFIQYFSNNISRNRHWRQYEKLSHPCVINYDFIGHFETMEEDGPLVLKMAGIADRVTFSPIHKSTNSDEVLEYYSQVPPEYITRIGELYRSDFEMFGYEYLGPVKKLLNQSLKG